MKKPPTLTLIAAQGLALVAISIHLHEADHFCVVGIGWATGLVLAITLSIHAHIDEVR